MVIQAKLKELEQVIMQIKELAAYKTTQVPSPEPIEISGDLLCSDLQIKDGESEGEKKCSSGSDRIGGGAAAVDRERELLQAANTRIAELDGERDRLLERLRQCESQLLALSDENREILARMRELRNEVIELRGLIRVVCRIRPVGETERVRWTERWVEVDGKKFAVDKAFGPGSSQCEVYQEFASLVESVLEGYSVCIFAYGQTGSGKTHTMSGSVEDKGIVFRACKNIEASVSRLSSEEGFTPEYEIHCIEIYNDTVRDLIGDGHVAIVDDGGSLRLKNCRTIRTECLDSIEETFAEVWQRRTVGETCSNKESSRSHSATVIRVRLRSDNEVREGALVLIDLAGSERLSESKAENERLKETQHINKSLSALGNVFTALKRGDKHVPFRDSKLTRFLREYLTGKARIAMIVNINPSNISESLCSMRFAGKVSECSLGSAENNVHFIS